MKIDIHTHTKKIKSGDNATREISPEKLAELLKSTSVEILAITNHNHFDLEQYEKIEQAVEKSCQIWPGVELDVDEGNGKRGHLIVIVNPINHKKFDEKLKELIAGEKEDNFSTSIESVAESFDKLDSIYIFHYINKSPAISEETIKKLSNLIENKKRILKEASNSISAGIFISHGHNSIYGSDIQDWEKYIEVSKELPELRLNVESFEQFCLLLDKDNSTINTLLDKKTKSNYEILLFEEKEKISLPIYNDINILFGSKGTGKTEILKKLNEKFKGEGYNKTEIFLSGEKKLEDVYKLKKLDPIQLDQFDIDNCEKEIDILKKAKDEEITDFSSYFNYFNLKIKNKNLDKIKINNISTEDTNKLDKEQESLETIANKFNEFNKYIIESNDIEKFIEKKLFEEFKEMLNRIIIQLKSGKKELYLEITSIKMLNLMINVFTTEISKKTGKPKKPNKTGFLEYARNRIKIKGAVEKILLNIEKKIIIEPINVGDLGDKGNLYCETKICIQNGKISDSKYLPAKKATKKITKTSLKDFSLKIKEISKSIYSDNLFEKLASLRDIEEVDLIKSIKDLLLFCKYFSINGKEYSPSSGESSMILLHNELREDKEIYILDEPEKSLGNDYISEVIVPLLKEKANLGKKIIIATHDANIAVRTLPYNSVYRHHDNNKYYTYVGNPFSNMLRCLEDERIELDWKEISMRTLEGGEIAFGERGKIYGK